MTIAHLLSGTPYAKAHDPAGRTPDVLLKDFVDNCVLIEPGTDKFPQQFQMGRHFVGPFTLPERNVAMSHSFRISKFEMTQDLYAAITHVNPSRWKGPRNSVESLKSARIRNPIRADAATLNFLAGKSSTPRETALPPNVAVL